jgi:hypothetical protein
VWVFSFFRAKCFRGKKVLGDYDIKVEQVISLKLGVHLFIVILPSGISV